MLSERFEMRYSTDLLQRVDEWRRRQEGLPTRAAAIRRLIEGGLQAAGSPAQQRETPEPSGSQGGGEPAKPARRPRRATSKAATHVR